VLIGVTGGFSSGVSIVNILIAVITVFTTYHLAGDVLCCGEPTYQQLGRVPGKDKKVHFFNLRIYRQ
jgi:hypothetical protein